MREETLVGMQASKEWGQAVFSALMGIVGFSVACSIAQQYSHANGEEAVEICLPFGMAPRVAEFLDGVHLCDADGSILRVAQINHHTISVSILPTQW